MNRSVRPSRFVCILPLALAAVAEAGPPPAPDALTEGNPTLWSWGVEEATGSVTLDEQRHSVGESSIRFTSLGGFDSWIRSPPAKDAQWDLSGSFGIRLRVFAENANSPPFQNLSPWIRLFSGPSSYLELHATGEVLNSAIGQWIDLEIPFAGNAEWERTVVGSPSLAQVTHLEIHADTWGYGFSLWFDGLGFDLPMQPPNTLRAYAGDSAVSLAWAAHPYATSIRVYRALTPITTTAGLVPIATLAGSATAHLDATAVNGVRYHYAVTATSGPAESRPSGSVGPRTPRNELDLQIATIARLPRYPRYHVLYEDRTVTEPGGFGPYRFAAAVGLGDGQTASTRRFPDIGDSVTYSATIRNRGTVAWTGPIPVTWQYGSETVTATLPAATLAPGATRTASLVRPWPAARREVRCTIAVSDHRPGNDTRAIASDSVAFLSFFDRTYDEDFREASPDHAGATTDDLVDWLQSHLDRFNQLFAEASCGKRVHYDVLTEIDDGSADPSVNTIEFGIFPFRFPAGERSYRETSGYYDEKEDIDYGLLHEMGHQLGLIDLYRLSLGPDRNLVNARPYQSSRCLMNGSDHFLSTHSAGAMSLWRNVAHGYYGQYLYRIPDRVGVRILGGNRQPLAGATVRVYQKAERPGLGELITPQVKFTGTTGPDGVFMLPNVAIDPSLVPPALTGDTLGPNPFGYVAVVGTNGVLLLEIERDGFRDFAWLDIVECNEAWFAGLVDEAIFERSVGIGGYVQRVPPADLAESNAGDWGSYAEDGRIALADDRAIRIAGTSSIRATVTGGFDNAFRYPGEASFVASWDLSGVTGIRAGFRALNDNDPTFQSPSPWFRLVSPDGHFDYRCCDLLSGAIGQWIDVEVPIDGDAVWERTAFGSPDLSDVRSIEIHADTWGHGFTVWMDGVHFFPSLGVPGDLNLDGRVDPADLAILLGAWGTSGPADLNGDGTVSAPDLGILLSNWS